MTNVKHKLLAVLLSVPILCNICAFNSLNAFAEESNSTTIITGRSPDNWDKHSNFPDENGELRFWMDDLEEGRMGTLSLKYTAEDTHKPISGAQVSLYKIASLSVKNGDAKYTLIDELKEAYPNLDFAGMTTEELDATAEEMSNRNLKEYASLTTDNSGKCKFENIEPGLYIVKQKAQVGMAKDYEDFKSFIINIPFPQTEDTVYTGEWQYDVESLPKTEIAGKKKLLIVPPSTGDETNLGLLYAYTAVFGISTASTLTAIVIITKRKKGNI